MRGMVYVSLRDRTRRSLEDQDIKISEERDQYFLVDERIISEVVSSAQVGREDVILEIGPGTGNLTKKLALKAKKVIAVEADERFRPLLEKLPENVDLVFEDAWKVLTTQRFTRFNKIVASIPYRLCEPLMHYLNFARHVELTVLVVPKGFALKASKNPVFSAFLTINRVRDVPKESFYPVPRTDSAIVRIVHRPCYEEDGDESAFIRRKLYMQEDKKLKNGLVNAITDLYALKHHERLTKRRAKEIIRSLGLSQELLEKRIEDIPLDSYTRIAGKIVELNV